MQRWTFPEYLCFEVLAFRSLSIWKEIKTTGFHPIAFTIFLIEYLNKTEYIQNIALLLSESILFALGASILTSKHGICRPVL